jgi:plastocyanin
MMRFVRQFLIVAAALLLTLACGSEVRAATVPQALTVYVFGPSQGIEGSDGQPHEAFVPSSLVVKAGTSVRLTFVNYSRAQHNFVQPQLNLDLVIAASRGTGRPAATAIVFTPAKKGVYRWFCSLPCDVEHGMWAMGRGYGGPGREGFMAGNIVVL